MTFAVEPQEQSVATELEQAATVLIGDCQDRLEAATDRIGDLFRALPAFAGELLGELGEAGNVDERRGAFGSPAPAAGIIQKVLLERSRDVRAHALRIARERRRSLRRGCVDGFGDGGTRIGLRDHL